MGSKIKLGGICIMFKKLLVVVCAALFLTVGAGSAMAFGDCGGEPCTDVTASALPNGQISQAITAPGSDGMNGGKAVGDFVVGGEAQATGKKVIVGYEYSGAGEKGDPGYYQHKWGRVQFKPGGTNGRSWTFLGTTEIPIWKGEATAFGIANPTMTSSVNILTNGKQFNSGLSYSFVKSTSEANIDGKVWAKGTQGCLQTADIWVEGSLGAYAYGGSYVEGPNDAFAEANGWGQTTVGFVGHDSDQSTYGFFGPNKASVDFSSSVEVEQSILNLSYVSPDGTTAANFAYVGGGSASLNRGSDASLFDWFGQDNINLTGIEATGAVAQNAMATNGYGSFAYGGSSAYFSGAVGNVESTRGWCGPDQTATVGGMAVVGGYNNVTTSPGSVSVTSVQFGHATTGGSGPVQPD